MKKILILGLPGAGKTTISLELTKMLNAVHFNADEIRKKINTTLGFSIEDRIEHARRMGALCDIVIRSGQYAIADFVCPLPETREAFGLDNTFVVFVNRKPLRDFADTTKIFVAPNKFHVMVDDAGTPSYWANKIKQLLLTEYK
jgi:adenylylsulfate kinase-like enzyme